MPTAKPPRRTVTGCLIVSTFLAKPRSRHYGYEIMKATGLKSGVVYPALGRFVECGWLEKQLESLSAKSRPGRPPRTYYRLTSAGRREAQAYIAPLQEMVQKLR